MKKQKMQKVQRTQTTQAIQRLHPPLTLLNMTVLLLIVGVLTTAAYIRNGIYLTHVTLWANVVKSAPNKRRAHENYGQALSTAGSEIRDPNKALIMYKEALNQFNTVLALPDDGSVPPRDLYREIGVVYFRLQLYDAAISSWQTGLSYALNDPSLLNNLSIAYLQTRRFDEAAAAAQTALMVDPNMPQALNTMGQVSLVKKDYEGAAKYFLMALDREPDVPSRYWNAALALEQAGKYDMALKYAGTYVTMEQDASLRERATGFMEHVKKKMGRP